MITWLADAASCPSEGLTLCVLRGADGAVAVQSHGVMVEGGDVGLAPRQAGRHLAGPIVRTHSVVTVDVGRIQYRFLQGSHTQVATLLSINCFTRHYFPMH